MPTTKVHVYSIMWNEEFMLPYFLRHYSLFADRIFIINDHSTDKTAKIAQRNSKVTMLDFPYSEGLNEDDFNRTFAAFYKKYSRGKADWVMCVDADELVYNKDILTQLTKQRQNGISIIKTTGFTMIGKRLTRSRKQLYELYRSGLRTREYDKPIIFDPALDITFTHGRHDIKHSSDLRPTRAKIALLHFKYLSKPYFLKRATGMFARTPSQKKYKDYRIARGLKFYEQALKKPLQKII